jgi:hypothetical protein
VLPLQPEDHFYASDVGLGELPIATGGPLRGNEALLFQEPHILDRQIGVGTLESLYDLSDGEIVPSCHRYTIL